MLFNYTGDILKWQLLWNNITTPASSGSFPSKELAWLDGEDALYVGVIASNARSNTNFLAKIDYFSVRTIPESNCLVLISFAALLWGSLRSTLG